MAETRKLSSKNAVRVVPQGNAVPTSDESGRITMATPGPLMSVYTANDGMDFDEATTPGIYNVSGDTHANKPVNNVARSIMYVVAFSYNNLHQILVNTGSSEVFVRTMWDDAWRPWQRLTMSPVTISWGG